MDSSLLWKARGVIISAVLGALVIFGGIGWLADLWLGTRPKLFLLAILLSFPISNILAIYFAKRMAKSLTPSS